MVVLTLNFKYDFLEKLFLIIKNFGLAMKEDEVNCLIDRFDGLQSIK